uniref:Putative zinc finger, C3HC4 type (RING finger) domain protein n=1 Tax=Toxoplasma gondii COUG TaxID=1074873 RepID=A0A2G8Y6G9_TOXGO|nr:putative zinc finger, C3HC4 type (RING finger) domain protein [Toxoplasma gondii COUG]
MSSILRDENIASNGPTRLRQVSSAFPLVFAESSRNSNHTRGVRRMQPRRAKASPVTRPTARPLRPASSSASDLREEIQLDAQNRQPDVADTHEIEVLESVETTQA